MLTIAQATCIQGHKILYVQLCSCVLSDNIILECNTPTYILYSDVCVYSYSITTIVTIMVVDSPLAPLSLLTHRMTAITFVYSHTL